MRCRPLFILACCAGLAGRPAFTTALAQSTNSDMDAALRVLRQLEDDPNAAKQAAAAAQAAPAPAPPVTTQPEAAATPAPAATETDPMADALRVLRQLEDNPDTAKPAAPPPDAQKAAPPAKTATSAKTPAFAKGGPAPKAAAYPVLIGAPVQTAKPAPTPAATDSEKLQSEFLAAKKAALQAEQKFQDQAKQKALDDEKAAQAAAEKDRKEKAAQAQQERENEKKLQDQRMQEDLAARMTREQEARKAAAVKPTPAASDTISAPVPVDATTAQQQAALLNATSPNAGTVSQPAQPAVIMPLPPTATEPSAPSIPLAGTPSAPIMVSAPPAGYPSAGAQPPMSKEEKLADLLRQWRAGEITPLQYHTRRAEIIAEP